MPIIEQPNYLPPTFAIDDKLKIADEISADWDVSQGVPRIIDKYEITDESLRAVYSEMKPKSVVEQRCRNCRFWKQYSDVDYGDCTNEIVREQVPIVEGEGFRQDFGCIHFEVKDGNE